MKQKYTATYTRAKYVGTHPHISESTGVYYWSTKEGSYVFRPDMVGDTSKVDWYRVHRENLIDIGDELSTGKN